VNDYFGVCVMPMYGLPAGLLAFAGAGSGAAQGGFGGALGGALQAFGQAGAANAQSADREMQGLIDIARMQHQIGQAEEARALQEQERMQRIAQQGQAEELRGQIPAHLQELFDVDQKTAIARAFPEDPKASERYRVVGNQLFDISGQAPRLAATSPRDEGLRAVFDPETGQSRYVRESEAVGQMPPPKQGITIGPDGTVQIGGQATPLGKPAQGQLEKELISASAGLDRLQLMEQSYNPEYLTHQGAAKAFAFRQAEKAGVPIGGGKKEFLRGYTTFRANVGTNLAGYIKDMSGAAVSDNERAVLQRNIPSADDSDTEFQAKYASTMKSLKSAQARLNYIRSQGLDPQKTKGKLSLESMPGLIDQRGQELEQQLMAANPGAPPEEVQALVLQHLKQEFGI